MTLHHPFCSFSGAWLSIHHSSHMGMVSLQTKILTQVAINIQIIFLVGKSATSGA
jgi:hypothetical protein